MTPPIGDAFDNFCQMKVPNLEVLRSLNLLLLNYLFFLLPMFACTMAKQQPSSVSNISIAISFSNDADTLREVQPGVLLVPTHGYFIADTDSGTVRTDSIDVSKMPNIARKKNLRPQIHRVVASTTESDGAQKFFFIIEYHKHLPSLGAKKAYRLALKNTKKKYGKRLNFEHAIDSRGF